MTVTKRKVQLFVFVIALLQIISSKASTLENTIAASEKRIYIASPPIHIPKGRKLNKGSDDGISDKATKGTSEGISNNDYDDGSKISTKSYDELTMSSSSSSSSSNTSAKGAGNLEKVVVMKEKSPKATKSPLSLNLTMYNSTLEYNISETTLT